MTKKNWLLLLIVPVLLIGSYVLYQKLTADYEMPVTAPETPTEEEVKSITDESFDFTYEDKNGKTGKLSDHKGKPIVVNFWASWCPPCREEMPLFEKMKKENPDVDFLFINQADGQRETQDLALEFLETNGIEIETYFDKTTDTGYKYGLAALPATVIIDQEGVIQGRIMGQVSEEALKNGIELIKE